MSLTLQQMENELGARRLIARYAHTMDNRQLDECAALFERDAILTVNGQAFSGRDAIRGWMTALAGSAAGVHMTGNTVLDFDGDSARATSDFMYGRKTAEGWQFWPPAATRIGCARTATHGCSRGVTSR